MFVALLYFSTPAGFAPPNINNTFKETGYLTSSLKNATYKRLLETGMFFLDIMSDLSSVDSRGCEAALRVSDLALALGGFLVEPIIAMKRMGIQLSHRESYAFQAVWRHVGFYLGIEAKLLDQIAGASLALPSGSWADRGLVKIHTTALWSVVAFGRRWRAGWEKERIDLSSELIQSVMTHGLGKKFEVFIWKDEADWTRESKEPATTDNCKMLKA
ncbi:hypothetical protein RQP46_000918 [Phenoliferia psychrophenolica]